MYRSHGAAVPAPFPCRSRAALVTAQENLSALWRAGVFPRWNLSDKHGRGFSFWRPPCQGRWSRDPHRWVYGRLARRSRKPSMPLTMKVLQELIECPANDLVAFARSGFQPLAVDDL